MSLQLVFAAKHSRQPGLTTDSVTCWSCGTTDLMAGRDVCLACYEELHDLRPEDASEEDES